MYETKTFFHVTCPGPPCCIDPKVHRIVCAMQSGTDLRGLHLFYVSIQNRLDTNETQFSYTSKADPIQTEVVW